MTFKVLIIDVDGVMTDGRFYYTSEGKYMKAFGPDDNDGLSLLRPYLPIIFVTGDRKGFDISKRRIVEDMNYSLDLVSTISRTDWIASRYDLASVIYIGDGIFDHFVMQSVGYSIATSNADYNAKRAANYVTKRAGGDRAVAEACLHILDRFYKTFDLHGSLPKNMKLSGEWST